jgi:arylsulfatase A-like enzyme
VPRPDWFKPPIILYITADDHASSAIGASGSYRNKTPNIDRVASGGMRFDSFIWTRRSWPRTRW